MLAGLIAGGIAAVIASLVSLPLRSPVDSLFNTATVTVAALVVGVAAGLLWKLLASHPRRLPIYAGTLAMAFILVAVAALIGNGVLERLASFAIPLAAIVFVVAGTLATAFRSVSLNALRALSAALVVASLAVGCGLMGQGDAESGELSLPERTTAPPPAAAPGPTPVQAAPDATPSPTPGQAAPAAATPAPTPTRAAASIASSAPTDTPAPAAPTDAAAPTAAPTAAPGAGGERYVVGEGSEITFTVGEVLARSPARIEAVMRTTALSGVINADGQPSTIEVDLHSLSSDQQYRDRYVRSRMFPDSPTATFTVEQPGPAAPGVLRRRDHPTRHAGNACPERR